MMPAAQTGVYTPPTGNPQIDGVLWGYKWPFTSLTYGFPTDASEYSYGVNGFQAFNAAQITATQAVLANYAAVSGLTFTLSTDYANTNLRFGEATGVDYNNTGNFNTITTAQGIPPDAFFPTGPIGDTWYNTTSFNNPQRGTYAYATIIHEIGHALGLKHGHAGQGVNGQSVTMPALPSDRDSLEFSVMTYRPYIGAPSDFGYTNESNGYPQTLMMSDIAALQYMYGANFNTNNTDSVYTFSSTTGTMSINGVAQAQPNGNRIFLTIWDGGGNDTYDFSNYSGNQSIDLAPGSWSLFSLAQRANLDAFNQPQPQEAKFARANVYNAYQFNGDARSLIENAIGGSGNDTISGNLAANILTGNAGNDILNGLDGNDTLIGGTAPAGTQNQLNGGTGSDTASYLGTTAVVFADLRAFAGYVGGTAPANLVDTYNSIENLTGGSGNDTLIGDDNANVLSGAAGTDQLYGLGGDDTLIGGTAVAGTYNVLAGGTGSDTAAYSGTTAIVYADLGTSLGYVGGPTASNLADVFNSIENLTGGSANDTLIGDGNANVLSGAAGTDQLYGLGGDDTLIGGTTGAGTYNLLAGGTGSDTASYAGTTVIVYADLGTSLGYVGGTAAANLTDIFNAVENLTGGSANDTLIGDGSANVLTGAAGTDQLYGLGGDDTLIGGTAVAGTSNVLAGGTGSDTASYAGTTASVYADLAIFLGYVGGTAAANLADIFNSIENLTGGSGNDTLRGDGAANRLQGAAGGDFLFGLAGADTFVYRAIADSNLTTGYDIIQDFATGADKLDFSAFGINSSKVSIASGSGNTIVFADTDTVAGFDLAVVATGNNAVAMSDILFL